MEWKDHLIISAESIFLKKFKMFIPKFQFLLFPLLIFSLVNKIMATKQLNDVIPVFGPNMFIFSYCVYEENEEKQKQCINDNFPNGVWKLQKSEVLECDLMGNSCAYLLAINEEMRQIVVAFRGTTTLKQTFDQIWHGLANRCIPFEGNGNEGEKNWEKGFVNKYFYEALIGKGKGKSMWDRIAEEIEKLVQKGYATVIFTGHSLGGALASLASLLLFERKISRTLKIAHFSYGQPRVGCAQFAKYFEENIKFSFRFVHRHDIIAAIPPESMKCVQCNTQGYKHHGIPIPFQSQNVPCVEKCRNPMDCTKCDHNSVGISLLFIQFLSKWHIPRFMTDHFEYFNFNVKNKVHILTLMDISKLNFMKRIRIFVQAVLDIMKNCFGINEAKKFGIDSSMIDG